MMKECVVLNGKVINIGLWDYQYQQVQVGEDDEGNPIYEERAMNPLPEGATIEQREVAQDDDGGWYVVDEAKKPTIEDRLKATEEAINFLLGL